MKISHNPNNLGASPSSFLKKIFNVICHTAYAILYPTFYLIIYYEHSLILLLIPHRDHFKYLLYFIGKRSSYLTNTFLLYHAQYITIINRTGEKKSI